MFKIFIFTLKNSYRAIWMSFFVIVLTLVITSVLGVSIANMQETGVASKEKALIYNELSSPYREEFDDLLKQDELNNILELEWISSLEGVDKLIDEAQYDTVVVAKRVNEKEVIEIKSARGESYMFSIGANFASTANALTLVREIGTLSKETEQQYSNTVLKNSELRNGSPIGIDYYGVQTLMQMSALMAILGVFAVLDDKSKNIFPRMKTAPISRGKLIASRLLANVVYMVSIQVVTAIMLSVVLGVNLNGNYLVIVTVFALYSIIVTALGMLAATLTRSVMGSIGILIFIGSTLWPKLAGAFSPFSGISKASLTSPNFHAKNAIFSTIYGGSQQIILESILWMCLIAAVMLALYAIVERKKVDDNI